jgi:hypothetical protein
MATIAAAAIDQPLEVVQGATFEMSWIFKDINGTNWDFSGWTAKIEVRKTPGGSTALLTASTANTYITFPGSGEVRVVIPATDITALTFTGDTVEYYWDLELTNANVTPNRILKPFLPSTFTIYKEVTK